ncbi:MAG: D-amino-acid transaminase [Acidobacteria bacterium]|nr:D-amino-acid transaminase [Acidobacteriota bacterium]MBI3658507.1 D-amino-acid transaminase [Acidobacteriota bacterium]
MHPDSPTPHLSSAEAQTRLRAAVHSKAVEQYYAMYSSLLGGIVTDPAFMVIPIDDHMVHRGHAVFDTAVVTDGYVYQLDPHMDRLLESARLAKIAPPKSRAQLRQIILDTITVAGRRAASVRYWLSAGPGGFGLSSTECVTSSFFVMVFAGLQYPESYYTQGMKIITSQVPIKPPFFARVKSTNYLPNALVVMEAKEKGADNGLFLDERGLLAEGSNMNLAIVTPDGVLRHPAFDRILAGITIQRLLQLSQSLVQNGLLKGIAVEDITLETARSAREMVLVGSTIKVAPVVEWDGRPVGDGKPGPVARALYELWCKDQANEAGQLVPIAY